MCKKVTLACKGLHRRAREFTPACKGATLVCKGQAARKSERQEEKSPRKCAQAVRKRLVAHRMGWQLVKAASATH